MARHRHSALFLEYNLIFAFAFHVDPPRGIRKHLKHIVLGLFRILRDLEGSVLLPNPLPLAFYGLGSIPIFHLQDYCNFAQPEWAT